VLPAWLDHGVDLLFYRQTAIRSLHAAQSIVVFGGLHIINMVLGMFFGIGIMAHGLTGWTGLSGGLILFHLLHLFTFVLWIILMVKAYQGERFRVPFAADIADSIFSKS
jgi:uncharacterized membrane protein